MSIRNPEERFDIRIRLIRAAGITLSAEFTDLDQRARQATTRTGAPCRDRYITAVVENDAAADLDALWALALAEATPDRQLKITVAEAIRAGVNQKKRDLYGEVATANYDKVAALFNGYAKDFAGAASAIDPETDADLIVCEKDAVRTAWVDAATLAVKMTALLPALRAAAALAGLPVDQVKDPANDSGGLEFDDTLPLVVDCTEHNRAALWRAWDTPDIETEAAAKAEAGGPTSYAPLTRSRAGRWAALHRLDAEIRAVDLSDYQEFSRREPLPVPVSIDIYASDDEAT